MCGIPDPLKIVVSSTFAMTEDMDSPCSCCPPLVSPFPPHFLGIFQALYHSIFILCLHQPKWWFVTMFLFINQQYHAPMVSCSGQRTCNYADVFPFLHPLMYTPPLQQSHPQQHFTCHHKEIPGLFQYHILATALSQNNFKVQIVPALWHQSRFSLSLIHRPSFVGPLGQQKRAWAPGMRIVSCFIQYQLRLTHLIPLMHVGIPYFLAVFQSNTRPYYQTLHFSL